MMGPPSNLFNAAILGPGIGCLVTVSFYAEGGQWITFQGRNSKERQASSQQPVRLPFHTNSTLDIASFSQATLRQGS